MLLKDKVIVVAGVGPGMGRKLALIGAAEGAKMVLGELLAGYAEQVADEVRAAGGQAVAIQTDIGDQSQCDRLADAAMAAFGRIDGLINNAYHHLRSAIADTNSIDAWQQVMNINCFGALRMVKSVLPAMERRGGGIVNVSSIRSIAPVPIGYAYGTSKAALEGATRQLARELGPYKIRVNATRMGRMDGVPWQKALKQMEINTGKPPDEITAEFEKLIALGELPPDEDCARSVLFLVSDYAKVITGTTIDINGGEYMAA